MHAATASFASSAVPAAYAPDLGARAEARYWPAHALDAFLLQMAARGHCISATMMLGDRGYALDQLQHARAMPGDTLQSAVRELSDYFEDAEPAVASLHWWNR